MATSADLISDALREFPISIPPRRLLRFFRGEQGLRFLDNGKINLTPPTAFNDPFELCAAVPRRVITVDEMRACFLKANGVLHSASQLKRRLSNDAYVRWVEEVALRQREHWSKSFHDAAEGFQKAAAANYGIACFMGFDGDKLTRPPIVHYWDRYADTNVGQRHAGGVLVSFTFLQSV